MECFFSRSFLDCDLHFPDPVELSCRSLLSCGGCRHGFVFFFSLFNFPTPPHAVVVSVPKHPLWKSFPHLAPLFSFSCASSCPLYAPLFVDSNKPPIKIFKVSCSSTLRYLTSSHHDHPLDVFHLNKCSL